MLSKRWYLLAAGLTQALVMPSARIYIGLRETYPACGIPVFIDLRLRLTFDWVSHVYCRMSAQVAYASCT